MILAFCWFKQAVALVSFPRVALGTFVSSRTWVSTRALGKLCCVTSPGSWNLRGYLMLVLRWDGSVVTLLVLQRYGVYTVFDSRVRYLSQPVLRRESSGPSFRRWRASFESRKSYKRGSREPARTQARRFKPSGLDIAHRRLVQSVSIWGGAPPMGRTFVTLSCDEK